MNEGIKVVLKGVGRDPDGDTLNYLWKQTGGTTVVLSSPTSPNITFRAPVVSTNETLVFQFTVNDGRGGMDTDSVSVLVQDTGRVLYGRVENGKPPWRVLVSCRDALSFVEVGTAVDGNGEYLVSGLPPSKCSVTTFPDLNGDGYQNWNDGITQPEPGVRHYVYVEPSAPLAGFFQTNETVDLTINEAATANITLTQRTIEGRVKNVGEVMINAYSQVSENYGAKPDPSTGYYSLILFSALAGDPYYVSIIQLPDWIWINHINNPIDVSQGNVSGVDFIADRSLSGTVIGGDTTWLVFVQGTNGARYRAQVDSASSFAISPMLPDAYSLKTFRDLNGNGMQDSDFFTGFFEPEMFFYLPNIDTPFPSYNTFDVINLKTNITQTIGVDVSSGATISGNIAGGSGKVVIWAWSDVSASFGIRADAVGGYALPVFPVIPNNPFSISAYDLVTNAWINYPTQLDLTQDVTTGINFVFPP